MSARLLRPTAYAVVAALVVASIAAACSLNPQPIPPGEQPDGSTGGANPTFGDADGGTRLSSDAADMGNEAGREAGSETGPPPQQDAGTDAADASDATTDADAPD